MNNNGIAGYSKRILNPGHIYGSIINTTKVLIKQRGKESTWTHWRVVIYIYKMSRDGLQMNDACDTHNPIFEITQEVYNTSHYKGGTSRSSPTQQAFKNETGNEEQEGARHTKQNTRAHQRNHICNNRKIAAASPIAYFNTWWWPYRSKHVVTFKM
jgi:hypothetical protein